LGFSAGIPIPVVFETVQLEVDPIVKTTSG
jgi:hypothetical protein